MVVTMRFMATFAVVLAIAGCGGGGGGSSDGGGSASPDSYTPGPGPQGGAQLYADFRAGPAKLILHQRGGNAVTAATFRDRFASMESALAAYDGAFLHLPQSSRAVTKATALAAATVGADLEPLYALRPTRLKYNFAVVTIENDLDPFDDWAQAIANLRTVARVARDAGLVGIVIDNESLAGLRVVYPYDFKFGTTKTLEEYRLRVQGLSLHMMQAITAEFPDAVVVVMRGAAGAEPRSPASIVNCESRDPALVFPNASCGDNPSLLLGAFFAGFVEAATPRALLVDGGTDYGLRTVDQFGASASWRKTGIAAEAVASAFIPEFLRAAWTGNVRASFGVREIDGARGIGPVNDPLVFANTLVTALRSADHFVWATFDSTDLTSAAASQRFVVASTAAKVAAATPDGTLASQVPATGTGLLAQYFGQFDESELAQTIVDPTIENVWSGVGPGHTVLSGQADNISVVWSGYIEAPVTGTYLIFGKTDDGMQIFIGDMLVLDAFFFQAPTEHVRTVDLVAGQRYPIRIRYFQGGGETEAHFSWEPPGGVKEVVPRERLYPYR